MKLLSRVRLAATLWTIAHQAPLSMGFSGKNTEVGYHALLQGWNMRLFCLLHWEAGSLPLCHLGSLVYNIILAQTKTELMQYWFKVC